MRFGRSPTGGLNTKNEWTETIWNLTDQSPNDLASKLVFPGPDGLISGRIELLSRGWRLVSFTVYSNQGGRKRAYRSRQLDGQFPGTLIARDEQPYDKVLVSCSSNNYGRSMWIGGVPFGVVGAGGDYEGFPPGANADAIQFNQTLLVKYQGFLKANGWAIQHNTTSAPFDIKDVHLKPDSVPAGTGRTPAIQVVFTGPNPFTDGGKITISGVKLPANLNGQWTYTQGTLTGTSVWLNLRAKRKLSLSGEYDGGGIVRTITPVYEAITSIAPIRGTSRKVGDGPKSSRGRRSNRRT
jgi:hypothetical protein